MALYVYGIMRAEAAKRAVSACKTREGPSVAAVEHDRISALVTSAPEGELKLRRDNILAHADVLQAAFEHGPVLPLRFGTALPDEDSLVRDLLAPSATLLADRLDALEGTGELQVKAAYKEEPLLRSILAQDSALARSVRRSRDLPAAAAHFDQIRIGEAIASAVQARRGADEQLLLGVLRPFSLAVAVSQPHHERAVLNAAFLIETSQLEGFDAAVEDLSEQRASDIDFKLIGPLPPYSFAEREWESSPREGVRAGWA